MRREAVTLEDRYDLGKTHVLLNGTQAFVRLMLMQKARDEKRGHKTAGYVTGYRGSPLGAVDTQMTLAKSYLDKADVKFHAGLNEDLAATALWGTQQVHLRGDGRVDGVFGLWYGKGPGVDRSGDVMRHVNFAGTAPLGGVIMAMGDDHTGESSTSLHQSDMTMIDSNMPIVSPAGVQEILDLGLYGYALSRFCGLWVGLKTMKDTVEVTSVVNGDPERLQFVEPKFDGPEDGLHIRLYETPVSQEARTLDYRRKAALAFARANRIDKRVWGEKGAKIGFVAAGKNWLDLVHALDLLGFDEQSATAAGITTYKVAQVWPLDMESFREWAEGLDLIVVVEEKRKLIEGQIKEALYNDPARPRIYGGKKGAEVLFTEKYALDPVSIAARLGQIIEEEGCGSDRLRAGLEKVQAGMRAPNAPQIAARTPYFCAGCPHNSSTRVPEGSRAYAGIGCHYLVQFMERDTIGSTHMGGEGANWVGEAPFSNTDHVFQNMGDGTYNHSGVQAIRFALSSEANITFKILYNDAVAMTGGQGMDGELTAEQLCSELVAMGVKAVALVHDEKEEIDRKRLPAVVRVEERAKLDDVQRDMRETKGVTAIVYAQTCAAEKRRRRKKGKFPDPDKRVYINPDICEGCGDCGVQSNCVAVLPLDTPFGRKREIDQSACNKDFSCLKGFCPSFVTVEGGIPRKAEAKALTLPQIEEPSLPTIARTHNLVLTGIGGTGVVTIGAILAMAAHLDGKGASMMEMAGLAQKGGAVLIHCRIAERPEDIAAIRVATGECDALIGGDLVVSAGAGMLELLQKGRSAAVVNSHVVMTGEFTRKRDFSIPSNELRVALEARVGDAAKFFDASDIAKRGLGDTIYSNMVMFGAGFQAGLVPIAREAIRNAIQMNGASVEKNLLAFELGRWAIADLDALKEHLAPAMTKAAPDFMSEAKTHLAAYQGKRLVRRFEQLVDKVQDPRLKDAVARSYHKLLTYKDEYEVARLHLATAAKVEANFEGVQGLSYHLAPPILGGTDQDGRPKKRAFKKGVTLLFKLLAASKGLRGTPLDVFGYTAERRAERKLIKQFEADLPLMLEAKNTSVALALAELPMNIRGFGPVKMKAMEEAAQERAELLASLDSVELRAAE